MAKITNEIRFSHDYIKFLNIKTHKPVHLLEVFEKEKKELHPVFIRYDTSYVDNEDEHGEYKLTDGKLLILVFMDFTGNIFTTIRNSKDGKKEYYTSKRGEVFNIIRDKKKLATKENIINT